MDPSVLPTPRPGPSVVHGRFATVDGLRIFYREAGHPALSALILLHGYPSSSHMFRGLIPLLADRFHVIAPDYVGFGHSDAPPVGDFHYSFDHLATVVQGLLDELGVTNAVFYMQDYGGPIWLRLASARPAQVSGLVFQNANAYMAGVSQAAIDVFMPLWQHGDDSGARRMLLPETTLFQYTAGARNPLTLSPDAWVLDQALLDRPGSEARHLALFRDYQSNVTSYDAWHAYFRNHQPRSLVVWGQGDPFFTVAGAQAFREDLLDLEVHLLDGGHFVLEEQADTVAALIKRRFLVQ